MLRKLRSRNKGMFVKIGVNLLKSAIINFGRFPHAMAKEFNSWANFQLSGNFFFPVRS